MPAFPVEWRPHHLAGRTRMRAGFNSWKSLVLALFASLIIAVALASWLVHEQPEVSRNDCALTPSTLLEGTFRHWRLSMSPAEGLSGEVSAAVDLEDGRQIVAYNVTDAGGLSSGDRVTVAEIQCVHRRIYLIHSSGKKP